MPVTPSGASNGSAVIHVERNGPSVQDLKACMPAEARARSARTGMRLFAASMCFYLGCVALLVALPWWWAKALLGPATGLAIGTVFIVAHDAGHGALTPHPKLNEWFARVAFAVCLHPLVSWEYSHNGLHHGWTNLRGRDPAFAPVTKDEYDAFSWTRRVRERTYRSMIGILLFYLFDVWWKVEMFPTAIHRSKIDARGSFTFDRRFVCIGLLLQMGVILACASVPGAVPRWSTGTLAALLIVGIAWPYFWFFWLLAFFTFQQHTNPRVAWFDNQEEWSFFRGQIQGTVHLQFPRVVEFFLSDIMHHTAHHVDPKIPIYNLASSQRALEASYGDDIVRHRWTPVWYWRLFRTCQLYDYRSRRWMSYDGEYTTPVADLGI